jgi:hypothetical protein
MDVFKQVFDRLLLLLGKEVVTAKDRRDDLTFMSKHLLERPSRTDRPRFDTGTDIALFFAADLGEKLIEIVDDADLLIHVHDSRALDIGELTAKGARGAKKEFGVFPAKTPSAPSSEKYYYLFLRAFATLREIIPNHSSTHIRR